ncbi:pre-mRNA-splicing factor SLU7-like [Centruroides sculpturatus]|uniref:pre-mRNA-splicing factor SLU7-like n=1 Tax=Centruroides sculpturatus TaxID=218467 RepID=UPI000C6CA80B|nr:pre-mRNA-splicing factor SLU7-like [Centruroides sculpturatus]
MNPNNRLVSEIIRNRDTEKPKKRSREDLRKAKELEEAMKAGTAPAAVKEKKDINPHIPQYIATATPYFGSSCPTLKHQRLQPERQQSYTKIKEHFVRGLKRPRKRGAKFTNENIAEDKVISPDLNLDYDGKRDRWNRYDPANYQAVVEEFAKVEEAKRQLKKEKLKQDLLSSEVSTIKETNNDDEDEEKYAENANMPGTKFDSEQQITVRNLRIREDTAKYLRNLDPNSAYYDSKTKAMRDNPYQESKNSEEFQYAGDNFVKATGDTEKHSQMQMFAWQAYGKRVNIPKNLTFPRKEDYVECSRHGVILKGTEKPVV